MKSIRYLLHILLLTGLAPLHAQGPLLPPSLTPAPTMKSLDQIEARTPIGRTGAIPLPGPHFTITQPGSYYLTGNITVSTGDGILITAASDVSIDLNGFTIKSTLTGSADGSAIFSGTDTFARLTVKNGSLASGSTPPGTRQGFRYGIKAGQNFNDALISGVHVHGMSLDGISVNFSIVENCTATENGSSGFNLSASSITNCTATSNGQHGISALGCSVSNCVAAGNVASDIRWSGKIHNSSAETAFPSIP